jgi:hypothetical protein
MRRRRYPRRRSNNPVRRKPPGHKETLEMIRTYISDENKIKLEETLALHEDSVAGFKLLRKDYDGIKKEIKKIEKKRLKQLAESPERSTNGITNNILSIEKKYVGIEKAIKNYKVVEREYIRDLKYYSSDFEYRLRRLNEQTKKANNEIAAAYDCIRITKRYFNYIDSTFKSYEHHKDLMKLIAKRNLELAKAKALTGNQDI